MQSLAVIFSLVISPFCASVKRALLVSLFFLFFSQGGCTHTYIISLPSQTHTHFPCVLLYFNGLAANVCLGLNVVQRYENRSAGFVASSRLQYLFLFGCCPNICWRKIKIKKASGHCVSVMLLGLMTVLTWRLTVELYRMKTSHSNYIFFNLLFCSVFLVNH